jgi:ribosomal protein S27AE
MTTPIVELKKSSCTKCGSTEHTGYHNTRNPLMAKGITPDGRKYNCVIYRRTRCSNCGQSRIDKSFELIVENDNTDIPNPGQIETKTKPNKTRIKKAK